MKSRSRRALWRDRHANLIALEGVLAVLIMLSAVHVISSMRHERVEAGENARTALATTARDAVTVLSGLREARGDLLSVYFAEALDCAQGLTPSSTLCEGQRPANLTHRLEGYLPAGAAYRVSIDNGIAPRTIYATRTPEGERVSSDRLFVPDWNVTFVTADLSCHDPSMTVNVTAVPVWHGEPASVDSLAMAWSGGSVNATQSGAHLWNATLPPSAADTTLHAQVNASEGALAGATLTRACDLEPRTWDIRAGLNESTATTTAVVPVGQEMTFTFDFSPVEAHVPEAHLLGVEALVIEPVPGRPGEGDAFLVAARIPLGTSAAGSDTWTVPGESFFGLHPVLFVASYDIPTASGTETVELRLVTTSTFALPNGIVPVDSAYRAVLETWLLDWH